MHHRERHASYERSKRGTINHRPKGWKEFVNGAERNQLFILQLSLFPILLLVFGKESVVPCRVYSSSVSNFRKENRTPITMTLLWVQLAPLSPYIPLIWKQFRSEQSSKTEVSPWLLESNIRHLYAYIGCLKEEDGGDRRRRQLIDPVAWKKCGLTTLS